MFEGPINSTEARQLISELQRQNADIASAVANLQTQVATLPSTFPPGSTPQAVNQIRNGNYSHSVNSWNDNLNADNGRYECAWWFSHPIVAGQAMYFNDSLSGGSGQITLTLGVVTGDQITIASHGLQTGTAFQLVGVATSFPDPLVASTTYYVIRIDANTIEVASSLANALAGTQITLTNTETGGTLAYNYTLKDDSHTVYSEIFSDWDIPTGAARFNNSDFDLSTFLPGRNAEAGRTMYLGFQIVRTNQYVTADPSVRVFAGLYGESTGLAAWTYLHGAFEITPTVSGTVSTPTQREYRVKTNTTRGFSLRTSVETVVSAPSDADFTGGARVILQWPKPILYGLGSYDVYRKTDYDITAADSGTEELTSTGISFETGQPITITGTNLPAPLVSGTVYYAISITANTFQVAASEADALAGSEINLTTNGTSGDWVGEVYVRLTSTTQNIAIDNNGFQEGVTGWPSADFDTMVAYTASAENVVANFSYEGDPNFNGWTTLPLAIPVPNTYDKSDSDLDSGQWLRFGLTGDLDMEITGDVTATFNSNQFTTTAGQFYAGLVGKSCVITSKDGATTLSTTITVFNSADDIQTNDNWVGSNDAAASIYITGGAAAHSLSVDLTHLTFIEGAGFSPNPEDISPDRGNPAATPNGTTQGPTIPGQLPGNPDGFPTCLHESELVLTEEGLIQAGDLTLGMRLIDPLHDNSNTIVNIRKDVADVWLIETENECSLLATRTKKIYTSNTDTTVLGKLNIGDTILTRIDGEVAPSRITAKSCVLSKQIVVQLGLLPEHSFLAGHGKGHIVVDNNKPVILELFE